MVEGKTHEPRFAAELAVHFLKEIDFSAREFEEQGIVGAEWYAPRCSDVSPP